MVEVGHIETGTSTLMPSHDPEMKWKKKPWNPPQISSSRFRLYLMPLTSFTRIRDGFFIFISMRGDLLQP